jgi:DNA-binding NtrC family response regulator
MVRIIVIDNDNASNQHVVSMLQMEGFNAIGVLHADHGLKLLETRLFHLIVTEIVMPERDGIEVMLSMKKNKISVPVIAVSGGGKKIGPEYYLKLAQQFGATYTFTKPVNSEPFLYAIRKCISEINNRSIS